MEWKDIEKVNAEIKTTNLKGKEYAEVKERVIAYRKLYPQGIINTEVSFQENYVLCVATATNNEGTVLSKGHARELLNKAFALENCETSAIGRCLGFMGLGISTSIATKEDMEQIESPSGVFDEPVNPSMNLKDLADEFRKLYTIDEQAQILNGYKLTRAEDIGAINLQKYINFKKYGKKQTN